MSAYKPPFPWFGGKSTIADLVWHALGDVPNYVEPFFGSGAVLFLRPHEPRTETVNDKDGFVSNFWRAVQADAPTVAQYADWPVNENDLHARHIWLVGQKDSLASKLEGTPDYYDAKIAGWWVWGLCCWIGGGWCNTHGPWHSVDGELVHLGTAGQGIHRQLVHLGTAGQGIHRQLVHLGNAGKGIHRRRVHLADYLQSLADRLRHVRVASGDWQRVCGPSPTTKHGVTGVFLDPPYAHTERDGGLYGEEMACSAAVRAWAIAQGDNPLMRIVLCGYDGEHAMPDTWQAVSWKTQGGYGTQGNGRGRENARREMLWCSPHCLTMQDQMTMLF